VLKIFSLSIIITLLFIATRHNVSALGCVECHSIYRQSLKLNVEVNRLKGIILANKNLSEKYKNKASFMVKLSSNIAVSQIQLQTVKNKRKAIKIGFQEGGCVRCSIKKEN